MTPAEYDRLYELFGRAVELPQEERARFVEAAAGGDEGLKAELAFLLKAHEQTDIVDHKQPEPAVSAADSLSGNRIGRYAVGERIGEGGMAVVYRGEDVELRRPVALKFLSPVLNHSDEARERFLREARTAAAIDHPNVCPVYEINAEYGRPFIAMAFLEGRTVADALHAGPMEIDAAIDTAIQACRGLEAAHAKGIVHRDIKPSNLMLVRPATGSGRNVVKILDFGVASYERERTITTPGTTLGTVSYMSPEQIASGDVDHRTDLWSLGATLYEMVAGRAPFDRPTMRESAAAIAAAEPTRLSEVRPEIPPGLDEIISKLLRKDPKDRCPSAADLLAKLESLSGGRPHGREAAPAASATGRAWLGVAAAAMLLVAMALFFTREQSSAPDLNLTAPSPLTTLQGAETGAAISPDESRVAFTWEGDSPATGPDLYVKAIGSQSKLRLTDAPGREHSAAWSPDGTQIAFVRGGGSPRRIFTVSALGGPETEIAQLDGSGRLALDWSPDGATIAAAGRRAIHLITLENRAVRRLTSPGEGEKDRVPRFDPAGEHIAFLRLRAHRSYSLWLVRADGGGSREIVPKTPDVFGFLSMGLAWTPDGKRIVFPGRGVGPGAPLLQISVEDGSVQPLPLLERSASEPHIRGNRLAYTRAHHDVNIWEVDRSAERQGPLELEAFATSSQRDESPQYSPDGRFVAYSSDRSGSREIWRSNRKGEELIKLTSMGALSTGTPRWSPDGTRLLFYATLADGDTGIYLIGANGGAATQIDLGGADGLRPSWTADGRSIYFSVSSSGLNNIWRAPVEGGAPSPVTTRGGYEGFESSDGRRFYYSLPKRPHSIVRVDLETGEEDVLPGVNLSAGARRHWALAESGIYFLTPKDRSGELRYYAFENAESTTLGRVGVHPTGTTGLAVSPDESSILIVQRDEDQQDIMLVEGFR